MAKKKKRLFVFLGLFLTLASVCGAVFAIVSHNKHH